MTDTPIHTPGERFDTTVQDITNEVNIHIVKPGTLCGQLVNALNPHDLPEDDGWPFQGNLLYPYWLMPGEHRRTKQEFNKTYYEFPFNTRYEGFRYTSGNVITANTRGGNNCLTPLLSTGLSIPELDSNGEPNTYPYKKKSGAFLRLLIRQVVEVLTGVTQGNYMGHIPGPHYALNRAINTIWAPISGLGNIGRSGYARGMTSYNLDKWRIVRTYGNYGYNPNIAFNLQFAGLPEEVVLSGTIDKDTGIFQGMPDHFPIPNLYAYWNGSYPPLADIDLITFDDYYANYYELQFGATGQSEEWPAHIGVRSREANNTPRQFIDAVAGASGTPFRDFEEGNDMSDTWPSKAYNDSQYP